MLDFPAFPTDGQQYSAPNGVTYEWEFPPGIWSVSSNVGAGATIFVGDTAPPQPAANMLWWNSILGAMFIWYYDGNTTQWVPATPETTPSQSVIDFSPRSFGAKGDGVTDDTVALQTAINACKATGGGEVNCTGGRWLIDSADLIIPQGVFLVGPWSNFGRPGGNVRDFSQIKSAFIINPAFTLKITEYDAGIQGMVLLRKGIAFSANMRAGLDQVALFAGKAVTIDNDPALVSSTDVWLSQLFILGFEYGIYSVFNHRSHIQYIQGDNTNGIFLSHSSDMQHLSHVHFWPFGTSALPPVAYVVSNAANNGSGLIRLTVAANVIITGDRVTVAAVGGVPNARGAFIATVINPTTIDLQGSTFAGAYTSGGNVLLNAYYRNGTGINFSDGVDWGQMTDCFTFNYKTGIRISNSNNGTLVNCGADAMATAQDTETIGIEVVECAQTALLGCKSAAQGTGLKIDLAGDISVTDHRVWGNVGHGIHVVNGSASFVNLSATAASTIRISAAVNCYVRFIGGTLSIGNINYDSPATLRASFIGVLGLGMSTDLQTTTNHVNGVSVVARLEARHSAPANNDTSIQQYLMTDSAGTQREVFRQTVRMDDVTAATPTSRIFWATMNAGAFTNTLALAFNSLAPVSNDGLALGAPGASWSDLYLASGAVLNYNSSALTVGHSTSPTQALVCSGQLVSNTLRTAFFTTATLPAIAVVGPGARAIVSDSTVVAAGNFGAAYTGGGANIVPVYTDNLIWRIG